tara:strand:- start:22346 stop:23962 length:1617 start_codon:yes stop_codon:yes gene_type:complete
MANSPLQLSSFDLADVDSPGSAGSSLNTGVLRRKYNFGDRVSELAIAQTPFFRFVSKVGKNPTDDPSFKFTERRPSFHKRYAYVVGYIINGGTDSFGDATIKNFNDSTGADAIAVGDTLKVYMAGDYKSGGNIQNVYGQTNGEIKIGMAGTAPEFFLQKQVIKIPVGITAGGGAPSDYILAKISADPLAAANKTYTPTDGDSGARSVVLVECKVVKAASGELASYAANKPYEDAADKSISGALEGYRSYVVGNAYEEGSGLLGKTWNDQPFSTGFGQTQIWRNEFGMTNSARATVLKYEANEWSRIWRDKLIEHKWDMEHSLLFGSQYTDGDGVNYTQGVVDYVLQNGNIFTMALATKTQDSFLDDLSNLVDPRYNDSQATVFFCSTAVYNWLHKLSGYFANNVANVQPGGFAPGGTGVDNTAAMPAGSSSASMGSADFAMVGKSKAFGVDISRISTIYGDMNIARHIMLDGTDIKMLAVNMKHVKYRPLVGNGVNRDTSIYVGVQSLENTGTDKRVDMILTEAGMEFQMPEAHAVWK